MATITDSKLVMFKRELDAIDKALWKRARFLTVRCCPYDMDDAYQSLLRAYKEKKDEIHEYTNRLARSSN